MEGKSTTYFHVLFFTQEYVSLYVPYKLFKISFMLWLLLKKSQTYLRRNSEGGLDHDGKIWAAPYRWGCIVIAYKKSTFQRHHLAPIEVRNYFITLAWKITTIKVLWVAWKIPQAIVWSSVTVYIVSLENISECRRVYTMEQITWTWVVVHTFCFK